MKNLFVAISLFAGIGVTTAIAANDQSDIQAVKTGTGHQSLYAVGFDGDKGVAVGVAGEILETEDGGKSWSAPKAPPSNLSLLGVAIRQSKQIAVGQSGTVLVKDGSSDWKKVASGAEESRLFSVSLNSQGTAVAVGSFGAVIKSTDAGNTWASIAPDWAAYAEDGVQPHIYAISVADGGLITMAGELGLILQSADGGATWKLIHKGEASIFALDIRADGGGYAVGQSGTVLRTADGGATWAQVDVGSGAILLGVSSSDTGKVVMTGMRDMLISDDGTTWRHVATKDVISGWYQGVSKTATGIFAVGNAGRIVRVGS